MCDHTRSQSKSIDVTKQRYPYSISKGQAGRVWGFGYLRSGFFILFVVLGGFSASPLWAEEDIEIKVLPTQVQLSSYARFNSSGLLTSQDGTFTIHLQMQSPSGFVGHRFVGTHEVEVDDGRALEFQSSSIASGSRLVLHKPFYHVGSLSSRRSFSLRFKVPQVQVTRIEKLTGQIELLRIAGELHELRLNSLASYEDKSIAVEGFGEGTMRFARDGRYIRLYMPMMMAARMESVIFIDDRGQPIGARGSPGTEGDLLRIQYQYSGPGSVGRSLVKEAVGVVMRGYSKTERIETQFVVAPFDLFTPEAGSPDVVLTAEPVAVEQPGEGPERETIDPEAVKREAPISD